MRITFPRLCISSILSLALMVGMHWTGRAASIDDGIVRAKSAYSTDETITRVKQDIAAKGITFFFEVDQQKLAADASIKLRR